MLSVFGVMVTNTSGILPARPLDGSKGAQRASLPLYYPPTPYSPPHASSLYSQCALWGQGIRSGGATET